MVESAPIIGRERELAALEQALETARLLTLTGVGGCGKTRVAQELVGRVQRRAGPLDAVVVGLASVRPGRVVDTALHALGARERARRTQLAVLLDSAAARRALLVLDNCEHVIGEVAELADALLQTAPKIRVLATSREPLQCAGEVVFRLAPLSVPEGGGDVAAVVRSEAGRFLVDRAVAADPDFALTPRTARAITRICRELDGLPLALELAAARVDRLTPGAIAQGLARQEAPAADVLPRHRSLRASLDWSHELLSSRERVVFRRLAAFAGGFTAAAGRAVALPDVPETDVRDVLETLEAKGLIAPAPASNGARWTLLQTVAEYASERLAQDDDAETIRRRHVDWFARYAKAVDGLLLEPGGAGRVEEEMPNLRLALEAAIEHDPRLALDIVSALTHHWTLAEHFDEARAAGAAALAAAGDDTDSAARAAVHCGAAVVATLMEDYANAVSELQTGLALMAAGEDPVAQARCLHLSSMVLILTGMDLDTGLASANHALGLLRASGDLLGVAFGVVTVAFAEGLCDRFGAARAAYDEFLAIPGASGHGRLRTWAELAESWAEVVVGSPERALRHADLALELEGDWPSMTHFIGVSHRIHALAHLGQTARAIAEGHDALARAEGSGAALATPAIEMALVIAELAAGELTSAEERGRRVARVPQLHTAALMREALARIALARGDPVQATTEADELRALAERTGSARHRALADLLTGSAAMRAGDAERGRGLLHAALTVHEELGLERGAADALDELALAAADAGDTWRAARLAGAAGAARDRLATVPAKPSTERLTTIGDSEPAAWDEGAALTLADAVAYARRSRGPRDRPDAGWSSLTPTEQEVAQLAATGLSNPQIATRLFMARGTVKMHLSNVYLKLGIANRTELARASATRAPGNSGQVAVVSPSGPS